jgi:hypothetical protein
MKRIFFTVMFVALVFGAAFGDEAFTVQTINGRVERQNGAAWTAIAAGDQLVPSTVIRTGINSSLVVKSGDKTFTVRAVQNGSIGELTDAVVASGVRIDGPIIQADTTRRDRNIGRISTNSARASDSKEDVTLVEE